MTAPSSASLSGRCSVMSYLGEPGGVVDVKIAKHLVFEKKNFFFSTVFFFLKKTKHVFSKKTPSC